MINALSDIIDVASTRSLTEPETIAAMDVVMSGKGREDDIADFLLALRERGETVDEITGATRVLRAHAKTVEAPPGAVDCCGTGGDGQNTYNVSTAVALVAAACGVPVAKHGNRAASSKSGAADVLEALGIKTGLSPANAAEALRRFNFTFLHAAHYHDAMRHVADARRQIEGRTLFNLLGPLANPAGAEFQLIGVSEKKWLMPVAEALRRLGTRRAWVVHGQDGLDEITVTAPTDVIVLNQGKLTPREINSADMDLPLRRPDELTGGDAATNAKALQSLLDGKPNAYRDIVLANTAAVLAIHDGITGLRTGVQRAAEAIDSGRALHIMQAYRDFSQKA